MIERDSDTGYGLLGHRVVRSLHNPCLASRSLNTVFKYSLNGIDHPVPINPKNDEEVRKLQNQKKIGKKKMFCEVDPHTELPPQSVI